MKEIRSITPDGHIWASIASSGHNFRDAVADLIDNTTDAAATKCDITLGKSFVTIADNGWGMDRDTLHIALTLGKSTKSSGNAGKYGLGLKTSAYTLGNKFVLQSRKDGILASAEITNAMGFECELNSMRPRETQTFNSLVGSSKDSGTVVQVTEARQDWGSYFKRDESRLRKDFGRIFRKFIHNGFELCINGRPIKEVDPFLNTKKCWLEKKYTVMFTDSSGSQQQGRVSVKIVELEKNKVNTGNLAESGFYMMRNNREISRNQTYGFFEKKLEFSAFRGEISFPDSLDEVFCTDFRKSGNELDLDWAKMPEIFNDLKTTIAAYEVAAKQQLQEELDQEMRELIDQVIQDLASSLARSTYTTHPTGTNKSSKSSEDPIARHFKPPWHYHSQHLGKEAGAFTIDTSGEGSFTVYANIDSPFYDKLTSGTMELRRAYIANMFVLAMSKDAAEREDTDFNGLVHYVSRNWDHLSKKQRVNGTKR